MAIRGTLLLLALCTAAHAGTVTLPTGDKVTVTYADGKPLVGIAPAANGSAFQTLVVGGHVYVVPQSAVAPADISAFDVTSQLAQGSLTPPSAPAGKLYTMTVKAFDRHGRRVYNAYAIAFNVDDSGQYIGAQGLFQGTASFSVPAGHYQVSSLISDGGAVAFVSTEVEVRSNNAIVVLDAKKANPISVTMPAPTGTLIAGATLQRTPATGLSFSNGYVSFGPAQMYAAPQPPVTVGSQYLYVTYRMGDERSLYDLRFDYAGGIPQQLDSRVTSDQLAAYQTTWHSSTAEHRVFEGRLSLAPWQADASFPSLPLTAPETRSEYVLPTADARWLQLAIFDPQGLGGMLQSGWNTPVAGERSAVSWNAQPLVPGIHEQLDIAQQCPACRAGDTLNLELFPYADNGGHVMTPESDLQLSASLYENGVWSETQPGTIGAFALSPDPATYQLVVDVARNASWWPTSARTHTVWTWSSAERAGDPLPSGWTCGGKGGGGGGGGRGAVTKPGTDSGCSFEPLLFASYDTHAGADDVVAGDATVDVTLRRQAFFGSTNIVAFTFDVSFDDGASWSAANVTALGDGRFRATYAQPAGASFASVKISASDDAGSALEQTIFRAYPLAPLPPASAAPPPAPLASAACRGAVPAPYAQCMARVNPAVQPDKGGPPPPPHAYVTPADLQSAYNLPLGAGAGRTVAIVDAYDDPNAEADMNVYRAKFGLPPCTTENGCFRKVNQRGEDVPPWPDAGWAVEISLDLQAVSAACPDCRILLVEADTPSLFDLGLAVDTAVTLGADAVSNSYSSIGEFSGETWFDRYYKHDGTAIVASSGDYGYGNGLPLVGGVGYPAVSEFVTAVGGTTLVRDGSPRGWSESAWAGSTSGCSAYIHKPGWQKDNLCTKRTVADIAAVADPDTGLVIYDSYGVDAGFYVVGGTSLSAPIIAAIYAMAGNTDAVKNASGLYRSNAPFFEAIGGSNGNCGGTYLCTGLPGYDAPTGLGTPNGTAGF